ncbi:MAG TPA: radical SAM protein [Stenomitos sp.]
MSVRSPAALADAATLTNILDRAVAGELLTPAEGVALLHYQDRDSLEAIREAANQLRRSLVGETVTYVVNRNINFTNICEQHCGFCAFRRDESDADAYWLNHRTILEKAGEAVRQGATEICMQGGLHPGAKVDGRSLPYYVQLVETVREAYPNLHLHAFSPQEIQFIAREDGLSYREVIAAL